MLSFRCFDWIKFTCQYLSEDISGNRLTGPPVENINTGKWDIPVRIDIDLMNNGQN